MRRLAREESGRLRLREVRASGERTPAKAYRPCPKCGSFELKLAPQKGLLWKLVAVAGIHRALCTHCSHRFACYPSRILRARCPQCAGLRLRDWEERYYWPPAYKRMLLWFGARRQRCSACRINFVSFRPRWTPPARYSEPVHEKAADRVA